MTQPVFKRSKLLVDKQFQGRALARLAGYWVLYHIILWHAMFLFEYFHHYRGVMEAHRQQAEQLETASPDELRKPAVIETPPLHFVGFYGYFLTRHYSILICAALAMPVVLWDMLKLTHKVAGPLVRFRQVMRDLQTGKTVREINLRDGDYLRDFQAEFNRFLAWYNQPQRNGGTKSATDTTIKIEEAIKELQNSQQPRLEHTAEEITAT